MDHASKFLGWNLQILVPSEQIITILIRGSRSCFLTRQIFHISRSPRYKMPDTTVYYIASPAKMNSAALSVYIIISVIKYAETLLVLTVQIQQNSAKLPRSKQLYSWNFPSKQHLPCCRNFFSLVQTKLHHSSLQCQVEGQLQLTLCWLKATAGSVPKFSSFHEHQS